MRVALRMLAKKGRQDAKLNPHLWKRFKLAALQYVETSDREVRVGWEWYYNGCTKVGASPESRSEKHG